MPQQETNYFIVTCHGCSASNWVAYTLNLHPKIACAHGSTATIATDPTQWDGDDLHHELAKLRRGQQRQVACSIDERYDELEAQKTAPFVGSVHTYRLRDLSQQSERFPHIRRRFRTVNLIRHPLDLVVSGHGLFQKAFRINLEEFSWTLRKVVVQGLDIVESVSDRYKLAPGAMVLKVGLGKSLLSSAYLLKNLIPKTLKTTTRNRLSTKTAKAGH